MKNEFLVSVVIPVYNGSNYLREAVESVLNQTYSNIEIIVVNDGSDDAGATEKIALSFGDRIKYLKKENGGVASALNFGIKRISGDFFVWLSHDDLMDKNRIEIQLKAMLEAKARISACSGVSFSEKGIEYFLYATESNDKDFIGVRGLFNGDITFCGIMLEKSIFNHYGFFDETLITTQDADYLLRILRKEKCLCLRDVLFRRRIHREQGTNTIAEFNDNAINWLIDSFDVLTKDELEESYGSEQFFIYEMILKSLNYPKGNKALEYYLGKLKTYSESHEVDCIFPSGVWIYGAGKRGRILLCDLKCRNIPIKGFLDSDVMKIGTDICGQRCFSIKDYDSGPVIISGIRQEEMEECLLRNGINNYYRKHDYDEMVWGITPSKDRIIGEIEQYYRE